MFGLFCFVLAVLASPFKSKSRLEAENAVLRHQLIVLRRKVRGRVRLTNNDRWFLIQLYRWFPSILRTYVRYYNEIRTHRSLDKVAPVSRPFSGPESLVHTQSLAGFITITSAFRFLVHTAAQSR